MTIYKSRYQNLILISIILLISSLNIYYSLSRERRIPEPEVNFGKQSSLLLLKRVQILELLMRESERKFPICADLRSFLSHQKTQFPLKFAINEKKNQLRIIGDRENALSILNTINPIYSQYKEILIKIRPKEEKQKRLFLIEFTLKQRLWKSMASLPQEGITDFDKNITSFLQSSGRVAEIADCPHGKRIFPSTLLSNLILSGVIILNNTKKILISNSADKFFNAQSGDCLGYEGREIKSIHPQSITFTNSNFSPVTTLNLE